MTGALGAFGSTHERTYPSRSLYQVCARRGERVITKKRKAHELNENTHLRRPRLGARTSRRGGVEPTRRCRRCLRSIILPPAGRRCAFCWPSIPACRSPIETNQGLTVEQLLACEVRVYPINPKSQSGIASAMLPAESRTTTATRGRWPMRSAWMAADGVPWCASTRASPSYASLPRRDRAHRATHGAGESVALPLHDYYRGVGGVHDWTTPATWRSLSPSRPRSVCRPPASRRWTAFLHLHRLWRDTAQHRLDVFGRATRWLARRPPSREKPLGHHACPSPDRARRRNLNEYRRRIASVFAPASDMRCFGSLPGTRHEDRSRLLGEIGDDPERSPSRSLQLHAGTAQLRPAWAKIYQRLRTFV